MNGEMIAKLKEAKSAEDIVAIAKEYGKEMVLEKAQELFDKLNASAGGVLSDEEVAAVAGGVVSVTTVNGDPDQGWKPNPANL